MDFRMRLPNDPTAIGPTSDFTYKWALNAGLTPERALGLSLAVTEVVTDVIRFAFPRSEEAFDIIFRNDISTAEVIISEQGEPFDPARYVYSAERARRTATFDGAGFAANAPLRRRLRIS